MRNILLGLGALILFFSACKKADLGEAPRLFRPVAREGLISEGNWVKASWQKITGADSYRVEISADTFKTKIATMVVDTNVVVFENLKWDKFYQVQVQAIAQDTSKNSKFSLLGNIKTPKFPSILNAPGTAEISDEAVKVTWITGGAAVTSIKILKLSDSSLVKEVSLNNTDQSNQYKLITGLTGSTNYIIYLYSGTTVRGWENFTTKAPYAGNIIDLRNITDRPTVLRDTLPVIPSGSTIILKRGLTYNLASAYSFDKSVVITSGNDLLNPNPATIFFTSNFNFASGSNIDSIIFRDLTLRSDNYGSRYVFNTTGGANVGKLSFENCHAEIFRGLVRLQSGNTNVTNFNVSNCIVDSIAGYGVLTVDNTTCKAENITIRNSTIYKAEKVITSKQNSTSVIIENCTINEAPRGGNFFIDYSTSGSNNVTNGVKINKCIIGLGKDNAGNRIINGIRVGTSTTVEVTNSFGTSDLTQNLNPIPDLTIFSGPSTDVWEDPFNGNFRFKTPNAAIKAVGDPRWK